MEFLQNPLSGPGQAASEKVKAPPKPIVKFWPDDAKFPMKKIQYSKTIDGETFEATDGLRYRLLGIDAKGEKTQEKRKYVQLNEEAAQRYLSILLADRNIYIETPPGAEKENPIPVYVWKGDNHEMVNLNARMIDQGYVKSHREYGHTVYDRAFKALEVDSKVNKRGIWNFN
ncbi:thermonuclease family protein [Pseudobacillus sp. 179-B 2D1 NHS]|uniref:thermonuclease family protein n=1 Tax=Pseudobacillus sp. 179-B 2D1 NHS TaxID=3374292 RepID=UPI0038794953